jgi:RND family efflux transporter MFP subunit
VTARETDIGALINAGSGTGGGSGPELFRVADIHEMRIYVQVPQQLSAEIGPGLTAELRLPQYPDKTFKAAVATTSSAINTAARTLLVELHAENPESRLQPGAYAQVAFALPGNPDVVRVPTSALMFRERGLEVAVIGTGDKIELRPVTLGRNLGTEVEVLKGLTVSDRVVNSPPDSLAAGDLVRIAAQQAAPGSTAGQSAIPADAEMEAAPGAKQR